MIEHNPKLSKNGVSHARKNDRKEELSRQTKKNYEAQIMKNSECRSYCKMKRLS